MADELELRLMRAIDPQHSNATTPSAQDEADSRHVRLTSTQGAALMLQPNVSRLRGWRDVAIIALLLATACAKARVVPFGDMLWARQIAELWLSGQETGPAFTRICQGPGDMRCQGSDGYARDHQEHTADVGALSDLDRWAATNCDAARFAPQFRSESLPGGDTGLGDPAESRACGCQDDPGLHRGAGWLDPRAYEPSELLAHARTLQPSSCP